MLKSLNIVLNTTNLSLKSHIILPQIIWRVETSKHYSTRETQPQRYNWHIVESGVKHHKSKPNQRESPRIFFQITSIYGNKSTWEFLHTLPPPTKKMWIQLKKYICDFHIKFVQRKLCCVMSFYRDDLTHIAFVLDTQQFSYCTWSLYNKNQLIVNPGSSSIFNISIACLSRIETSSNKTNLKTHISSIFTPIINGRSPSM
jgi:hypothetical protein